MPNVGIIWWPAWAGCPVMASRAELRRRIEDAEARASAVFGLSGPSAVDQLARRIRAFDLLKEVMPLGEDWEPSADVVADIALRAGISIEQVHGVVVVHNDLLRDC